MAALVFITATPPPEAADEAWVDAIFDHECMEGTGVICEPDHAFIGVTPERVSGVARYLADVGFTDIVVKKDP